MTAASRVVLSEHLRRSQSQRQDGNGRRREICEELSVHDYTLYGGWAARRDAKGNGTGTLSSHEIAELRHPVSGARIPVKTSHLFLSLLFGDCSP